MHDATPAGRPTVGRLDAMGPTPSERRSPRRDRGPAGGFVMVVTPRGGRYWDRTSDLFRVREARYRCANRPERDIRGGGDGIRTRVDGFAGRCLASRPPHHRGSRLREYPNGGIPSGEKPDPEGTGTRADDEIRTRDPHLGKVMRYHCATSAEHDRSRALLVGPLSRRRRELYTKSAVSAKTIAVHRACPPSSRAPRLVPLDVRACGQRARSGTSHRVRNLAHCCSTSHAAQGGAPRSAAERATRERDTRFGTAPDIRYYRSARKCRGRLAQLVARFVHTEEVISSSLVSPTYLPSA